MNDIKAKMAGRKTGESNQASVISKAPPSTQSACGGEGAATMRMQEIDVRELSDEMLIFMLQLMAPEKYGMAAPFGKDAQQRAVQQRAEIRSQRSEEMPESRFDFDSQDAGDELVMREDSPELSHRGSAAPGIQSAGGGEAVQQRAEIRDQRSGKMMKTPESASGFIPQPTRGELLMPQECPEFGGGGGGREDGVKAVEDNRTPSPGGIAEGLGENEHHWGVRRWLSEAGKQRAEIRGQRSETMPESRCDFVLHEAAAELLMPRDCPEFRPGKAESGKLKIEMGAPQAEMARGEGRDQMTEIRGQRGSSSQYAGTPVDGAVIFRHLRDAVGDSRTPESACDFVWQGTDGEILMPHESPEIGGGKAKC